MTVNAPARTMLKAALCLVVALGITGCKSETSFGKCVGLNGHERSDRVYEYSERNIVVGLVAFELVAPPVVVLLDELKCPVGTQVAPLPSIGPRP